MKTTALFCLLFTLVSITFLLLGLASLITTAEGNPNRYLTQAGGVFGLLASFAAWYIMYAGIADDKNRYVLERSITQFKSDNCFSFLLAPLIHLPWGEHGSKAENIQNELGQGRI
jgi:hypothetical protein